MLSHSLGTFQIVKAAVRNLKGTVKPLEWHYTLEVERYAKVAGDLLLVRPRVFGSQSSGLLETKEPRVAPDRVRCARAQHGRVRDHAARGLRGR